MSAALKTAPILAGPRSQRMLAALCLVFGLCSVAPLLAWVYGLGLFALWFWLLAAPGLLFVSGLGIYLHRSGRHPELLSALIAGALGGLVGTIAYDVCRLPFLAAGYRLFAPISSYGLLILNTSHSSPWTEFVGWLYNFANGIGFGVGYAMVARGRRWWWAIPWAFGLETMTIVTPYAGVYGLAGHLDIIAIAYGAHFFYAIPLGVICRQSAAWGSGRDAPVPVWWGLVAVAAFLVAWFHPWVMPAQLATAEATRPGPAVLVQDGRFQPEWVRVAQGGCVLMVNQDQRSYTPGVPAKSDALGPGHSARYCYPTAGIKRVQFGGVPYSGGFVIVDPALRP